MKKKNESIDRQMLTDRLSYKQLQQAKADYLNYVSISEISRRMIVPRATITYHALTYWKRERDALESQLQREFTEAKRISIVKMSDAAIIIVQRALEYVAKHRQPPTIKEAETATKILETIDKIRRLDDDGSINVTEEIPSTVSQIEEKLRLDPFFVTSQSNKEITDDQTTQVES